MLRRLVVSMLATCLACRAGMPHAQPDRTALPRVGVLVFGPAPSSAAAERNAWPRQSLRELGYVEGRNIVLDIRYADGDGHRLTQQAADLVRSKADVIMAGGPAPLEAARKATRSIPIVSFGGSDPVREGWAQTLARPGGNVTGFTVTFPELAEKQLELLRQAVPGLVRVAVLVAPSELNWAGMESSARKLGLELLMLEVNGPDDFEPAFGRAASGRAQGLVAVATSTIVAHRARLADLAIGHRLPSIGVLSLLADAGFLMTYGADLNVLAGRVAGYVDKILKGARPGDLPIERPTAFEMVINLKTAKALNLPLPQPLLQRADRIIE